MSRHVIFNELYFPFQSNASFSLPSVKQYHPDYFYPLGALISPLSFLPRSPAQINAPSPLPLSTLPITSSPVPPSGTDASPVSSTYGLTPNPTPSSSPSSQQLVSYLSSPSSSQPSSSPSSSSPLPHQPPLPHLAPPSLNPSMFIQW